MYYYSILLESVGIIPRRNRFTNKIVDNRMFSKKLPIIECLQRRFILECSGTKCATEKLSGFEYVMQNGHFPRVFAKHRSVIPRMFTEKRSVCIAFRKSWVFSGYSGFLSQEILTGRAVASSLPCEGGGVVGGGG